MQRHSIESNKVESNITTSCIGWGYRQSSCTLRLETGRHMLRIREELPACLSAVWHVFGFTLGRLGPAVGVMEIVELWGRRGR